MLIFFLLYTIILWADKGVIYDYDLLRVIRMMSLTRTAFCGTRQSGNKPVYIRGTDIGRYYTVFVYEQVTVHSSVIVGVIRYAICIPRHIAVAVF